MSEQQPTAKAEARKMYWLMVKFSDFPPLPYGGWQAWGGGGDEDEARKCAEEAIHHISYPADEVHIYRFTGGFPLFVFNHIHVVKDARLFISEQIGMDFSNEEVMANGLGRVRHAPIAVLR